MSAYSTICLDVATLNICVVHRTGATHVLFPPPIVNGSERIVIRSCICTCLLVGRSLKGNSEPSPRHKLLQGQLSDRSGVADLVGSLLYYVP